MIVVIENFKLPINISADDIQSKSQKILDHLNHPSDEITIVIDNNDGIQRINALYADHNYPTDVLSFSSNEVDPETGNNYLGDIIISFNKVESQAKDNAHPIETEIFTLIAHGILHLLGYDHTEPEEARIMFAKQDELIKRIIGG